MQLFFLLGSFFRPGGAAFPEVLLYEVEDIHL